jgi:hypothetical protein
MSGITEYIYGDEYVQKNKSFADELERIEEQYADFFKNRPAHNDTEAHDRLYNYYALRTAGGQVSFTFNEGNDLPPDLKQACIEAFHRIWKYE